MGLRLGKLTIYKMSEKGDNSKRKENNNIKDAESNGDSDEGKSSNTSGETTSCSGWKMLNSSSDKCTKKRRFKTSSKRDCFFSKKNKKWPMRGVCTKKEPEPEVDLNSASHSSGSLSCVCTSYRKTNSDEASTSSGANSASTSGKTQGHPTIGHPIIDLSRFNPADFPIDDEDERMRQERIKEIQEGVELQMPPLGDLSLLDLDDGQVHTQVDYIHCLVPDLKDITNCSFYWGKIDRYEAEKLLEGKPEGTFLLRDSVQEEYLFSVSFRRYGRSLHARIEQWNHSFSFDYHDPSVFSSPTVTGLILHYKDPTCCMFFEPMLTIPLHRNFPFDLQHLSRSVICSNIKNYNSINTLELPKKLKMYCKEYHYKQRIRVRILE